MKINKIKFQTMKKLLLLLLVLPFVISSCSKKGCTDVFANNFEEKAKTDDGSCEYDLIEGALAHYPLDGNGIDISGNSYNGLIEGGVTPATNREGVIGKALFFNGVDGRIVINDAPKIDSVTELTVSFWYLTYEDGRNQTVTTMSGKYGSGFQGEKFTFRPDLSQVKVNGSWTGIVPFYYETDSWIHFVMTYDGEDMILYQNGEKIEQEIFSGSVDVVDGSSIKIGQHWDGDPQWFDGKIDDLMIWGRALSETEVVSLYKSD